MDEELGYIEHAMSDIQCEHKKAKSGFVKYILLRLFLVLMMDHYLVIPSVRAHILLFNRI
jgi:hypothetical protein